MKKTMIALLCAGQLAAGAAPARAAELHSEWSGASPQMGSFAGARLRVPLGGRNARPQVGLALSAVQRSADGGRLRFSRGAEVGFAKGENLTLKLGGRPLSQLAPGGRAPNGQKKGFSTAGYIAIGASVVIIVGAVLIFDYISDQSE